MSSGGYSKQPDGSMVVALTLAAPGAPGAVRAGAATVRVVVRSVNRSRALTRLRNTGLRGVYLRGNTEPPTPDEITAVLHHPDGLIWRDARGDAAELWHPIRALWEHGATGPAGPSTGRAA
ncbi:hypothetical protein [Streptomyces sp. NPDC050560]|uniref:hypothetical protein n=1 Tax=Streptomyces sp. NPDC050560 TaxID=3365630 RepID=UPI00378CD287